MAACVSGRTIVPPDNVLQVSGGESMLKVIQVGLGGWGQDWHKNVLTKEKGIELTGFVDEFSKTLRTAGENCNLPEEKCFTSIEEALLRVECDAVVITASLPGHIPVSLAALRAGKHVLCEKPFAPSIKEAIETVELAREKRRILMVSQNYRHYPAMRWLQKAVSQEKYGQLYSVAIDFRKYANHLPRKSHNHYDITHPLLIDMAIHQFDLLRMVVGADPKQVHCVGFNPRWSNFRDPPAAFATIEFGNGVAASYRGSWMSHGPNTPWAGEWAVEFEKACVELSSRDDVGGEADHAVIYRNGTRESEAVKLPNMTSPSDRNGALRAFTKSIAEKKTPETSGRDNIGTLRFMRAMVESAETGKLVKIE